MATEKLGFVGAGRVGKGLSLALSRAGYTVSGVATREQAQQVADACDIVFLTVPDDALASASASLRMSSSQSLVHCSGAAELSVLKTQARVGGFHPLVMFADPEVAARNIAGAAIAVEAEEPLRSQLTRMVHALKARLLVIPPGARAAYHGGAHYAAAFVCASLAQGVEAWKRLGIPPDDALAALTSLARGAIDAVSHVGPARAMAGSIARGDLETVKRHVAALKKLDPALARDYCLMALKTVPLSLAAGGMSAARAEEIKAFLEASSR